MSQHEKFYVAPKVTKLGNLTELTQGGPGYRVDGNSGNNNTGNRGQGLGGVTRPANRFR